MDLAPPAWGEVKKILNGLFWLRLPLPTSVQHVNIYLLKDEGGWAILDAGFGDDDTLASWEALLAGPLKDLVFTRLIVTHAHIDHIGASGWLCARLNIPLLMNTAEYLTGRLDILDSGGSGTPGYGNFLRRLGLTEELVQGSIGHLQRFPVGVTIPPFFNSVEDGETLRIGKRDFLVIGGPGHSTSQLTLYCAADKLYLCADHLLTGVPPLLIQSPFEPFGDYYGKYLRSLDALDKLLDPGTLVLAGHHMPFTAAHVVTRQLRAYHEARVAVILEACREGPTTMVELASLLFPGTMHGRKIHYAVFEILAYVNRLTREGRLEWLEEGFLKIALPRANHRQV